MAEINPLNTTKEALAYIGLAYIGFDGRCQPSYASHQADAFGFSSLPSTYIKSLLKVQQSEN